MNEKELKEEINKIIKKIYCHEHKALKGRSKEWLERELAYLKKTYI